MSHIQESLVSDNRCAKIFCKDLREAGKNRETPSGTHLISGSNKDQHSRILRGVIKPQATRSQAISHHTNHMYVINTKIPLDDLDGVVIKEPPQNHPD